MLSYLLWSCYVISCSRLYFEDSNYEQYSWENLLSKDYQCHDVVVVVIPATTAFFGRHYGHHESLIF